MNHRLRNRLPNPNSKENPPMNFFHKKCFTLQNPIKPLNLNFSKSYAIKPQKIVINSRINPTIHTQVAQVVFCVDNNVEFVVVLK